MKKYIRLFLIFLVIILVVEGAIYSIIKSSNNNDDETDENTLITEETEITSLSFEDVGELVTQVAYATSVKEIDNPQKFFSTGINIPFGNKHCVFSYDCEIKAGLDFSQITWELDEENKIITVSLPDAKVISNELDQDSLEIYVQDTGVFNELTIEDINTAQSELKNETVLKAVNNGLLVSAKENAKTVVTVFFENEFDLEEYKIEFIDIETDD
ncbi:MAG: DUF4230 domain-containing protein [Erysipelotrichaceae bacterium]|nr:DUF4230 domain-containing protein [Erysipelotrichaceae bacterium]